MDEKDRTARIRAITQRLREGLPESYQGAFDDATASNDSGAMAKILGVWQVEMKKLIAEWKELRRGD